MEKEWTRKVAGDWCTLVGSWGSQGRHTKRDGTELGVGGIPAKPTVYARAPNIYTLVRLYISINSQVKKNLWQAASLDPLLGK